MEPLWTSLTMTVAGIFSSFSKILLKNGCLKNRYKKVVILITYLFSLNLFFYFELGFSRPPNGLVLALHC